MRLHRTYSDSPPIGGVRVKQYLSLYPVKILLYYPILVRGFCAPDVYFDGVVELE